MHFSRSTSCVFLFTIVFLFISVVLSPDFLFAQTSVNIPVESWVYKSLERLELHGFIKSGILSTKPFSRVEALRMLEEAEGVWNSLPEQRKKELESVNIIIKKLEREFKGDLFAEGNFKPIGTPYFKYLYSGGMPDYLNANNNGDILQKGENIRVGLSSSFKLGDFFSFNISPEFRTTDDNQDLKVVHGYGIFSIRNIDIEVGREPMWWGDGFHGGLLLTNNAEPFDMIRFTSQIPFLLPSVLSRLGPLKPTIFLTELEEERDFPQAKLFGVRLDFKPGPGFRFAVSRTVIFNGEGSEKITLSDWYEVLTSEDNSGQTGSGIDNNNIMALDFSVTSGGYGNSVPFAGVKLYGEIGTEDTSYEEWSKDMAFLAGLLIERPFYLNNSSLRIEWATTAKGTKHNSWYTHGIYSDGYRYNGYIMGHHMGTDADDLFSRLEFSSSHGMVIGLEADIERKNIHSGETDRTSWTGIDLTYSLLDSFNLMIGYGLEQGDESSSNVWTGVEWDF